MRTPAAAALFAVAVYAVAPHSLGAQGGVRTAVSVAGADATTRRITARETRLPIAIDGVLDEPAWRDATPATGFVQSEPNTGAPASEATEVRVLHDATTLYIGAYLHDSDPRGLVVNDIRKDFVDGEQDTFEVIVDTFHDRQNGYAFLTNVEGARADRQVANEGREINASWDGVWTVKTRRVADGWVVEMAIPFNTLRYDFAAAPSWGINFSRRIRRKNEVDFWAPIPREYSLARVSMAGQLDGVVHEGASRDLRIKPYVAGRTVRASGGAGFENTAAAGVDFKYGVTQGLRLDVTVNPDFAQVEADEQQVNLTQFSQFFPEKREFFLENSGIFYVGDAARNNRVALSPTPDEDLLLFFSRRIGLTAAGQAIDIPIGVRLSGQAAGFTIGALAMNTRATLGTSANNYGVLRIRRNIAKGSDVGFVVMGRQATDSTDSWNRVFGVDGNIRFFSKLDWNSYLIGTRTPGIASGQYAARTTVNYEGQYFHGKTGVMQIGAGFADDLGYFRRTNVRKWILETGLRPRPDWARNIGVRELHPHVVWSYYENLQGEMIGKTLHTGFTAFLSNGGFVELSANPHFERLTAPFAINPSIAPIPAGNYAWTDWMLTGQTDFSRPLALSYSVIEGGLWSGTQSTQHLALVVRPSFRMGATVGVSHTAATLQLPAARFEALLWTARVNYSFTTNMFLDALTQFDPRQHVFNANVRFNVIHHPLSDVFVVFNEQQVDVPGAPPVAPGRSVILKVTQMLSF